mmetsp:Transcript_29439/g.62539  ORF Transcript_29439/g.62539 Transcript_29439/m.62539 type:complete len:553 (-) Transcript_29439:137-1795(-)
MPGRARPRRNRQESRNYITKLGENDGSFRHPGVIGDGDLDKGQASSRRSIVDGMKRTRKSVLNVNREEGVLYTVKVAERPQKRGDGPPPQSDGSHQYTISKMHKDRSTWMGRFCRSFGIKLMEHEDVDSHLYRPSKSLAGYITWTFYASFSAVFLSFLVIFIVFSLVFAGFYALAGEFVPECIVVSGMPYGSNPESKFGDAFALSWTTFTTVGYGNVYTATGNDFEISESEDCAAVVFLCTLESFLGLIYAGMCAAILFGKVNRVQSHAHLTFAYAVCLQYESVDLDEYVDEALSDSDVDDLITEEADEDNKRVKDDCKSSSFNIAAKKRQSFREKFRGCPVIKFQVVNDFCNKAGGEIIDGIMKVVGIKSKRRDGKITYSQYVRVNLEDFEHPFFGKVWHGVHILDSTSPLLTDSAKQKIKVNGGSWPEQWFQQPEKVRRKLDFQSLVVTVAGISNVSACTVHAYKRYKFQDVIIGFDFAPLVYENESTGKLEVDLGQVNDVREQHKGSGEDLRSVHTPIDEARNQSGTSETNGEFSRNSSTLFQERRRSC